MRGRASTIPTLVREILRFNNADPGKEAQREGARLLVLIVPNFNARVSGNDSWGYDHSNKCQGNQKVVHESFSRCAAIRRFNRAFGPVLSLPLDNRRAERTGRTLSMSIYCIHDRPREPDVEIARRHPCANGSVIGNYYVCARNGLPAAKDMAPAFLKVF